ncbi:multiple epidermal growth factor-like domains protein 8 [Patagioenas fasciata monilis]|uniref:Multiple epidermal growth factor-like domains protein 8 n=1 Tax=Patagioenas fasciata monilis TaxID=372326 RepID=A0A1V4L1N5_PATFA|nr:multiple epidermal growth factor-like domains protein 8 [Patagioenas fasciata monilis]
MGGSLWVSPWVNADLWVTVDLWVNAWVAPQGPQCERCRPLFVGVARDGGRCRSCRSFCHQNSAVCVTHTELQRAREQPQRFPLDPDKIPLWVPEGPSEADAVCVNCENNSVGPRCGGCRPGFFLLDGVCTR